jgi:hypothetical protein
MEGIMIEDRIVEQLVSSAIAKLPVKFRAGQAEILRTALDKAKAMLESANADDGWTERCLRQMSLQFYPWKGQGHVELLNL